MVTMDDKTDELRAGNLYHLAALFINNAQSDRDDVVHSPFENITSSCGYHEQHQLVTKLNLSGG